MIIVVGCGSSRVANIIVFPLLLLLLLLLAV
jgi:hypothetical protein